MAMHSLPGDGSGDDLDDDGYDESQRAEILEATRDGPSDGLILTDLDPDLGDLTDEEEAPEDDLEMTDDETGEEDDEATPDDDDLDEDDAQDAYDEGRTDEDDEDNDDSDQVALRP